MKLDVDLARASDEKLRPWSMLWIAVRASLIWIL